MAACDNCSTPLDEAGRCVTCDAASEGLALLARNDFATIREMMTRLEEVGLGPEMERVPAARADDRSPPRWNLYVPGAEVEPARAALAKDWVGLLDDEAAAEAARRGTEGVVLAPGAEVACPACAERFAVPAAGEVECPGCGLGLGEVGADGENGGQTSEG
jgi:hypothetical protein